MRPKTLTEVAHRTIEGESFDLCLRNFLDEFLAEPNAEALATEPELLAPEDGKQGRIQDAYLAAVAEHLAAEHKLPIPSWVAGDQRQLHRPWFATPMAALRAVLIHESPPAFRARNLFVSANALSRA
jgi:hypothetical protein